MKYKILTALLLVTIYTFGQLEPAKIFSDNMVLQREATVPVWGTANPGERVDVSLQTETVNSIADVDGRWKVNLPQFQAGGPFILTIKGASTMIEFKNVMIGDVWFASGQSNMEHPVQGWEWIPHSTIFHWRGEISDSNYSEIRLFSVPHYPSPNEQKDLPTGKWEIASPESVAGFSSTAWFFGKELHKKLKVPIGIINSSWGGTPIQTWMSSESLELFRDSVDFPAIPVNFDQKEWSEKVEDSIEKNRIRRNQISFPKVGLLDKINRLDFDESSWKSTGLLDPGNHFENIVWLRKKIIIPETVASQELELSLGFLNRQSQIFLNGKEIGYFTYPQQIKIEIHKNLVYEGENILSIRLAQPFGLSQVLGRKEQFYIANSDHSFAFRLTEDWKANDMLESSNPAAKSYQNSPAFLYNGMVAPIIPFAIKGFIWYQGESDAGRPHLYEKMFQQMIVDWRKCWKQVDIPFLFIQTSNIELSHEVDKNADSWCLLREAQQKALSLPYTGMAVSVDIGDQYDVHPKNKQEFGRRLALQALKIAYHQDVIADGPVYESFDIKGDTVVVNLKDNDCPVKNENHLGLRSFEICGKDSVFHAANAYLRINKIYVFSEKVKNPVAVRYAWTNNPKCCLFNSAGLPLAPFRTDVF